MHAYKPLFCLDIEHAFFASGTPAGLHLVPVPTTSEILHKAGLLSKETGKGISLFCNQRGVDVLRLFAAEIQEPLQFSFKVFSQYPAFGACTEPAPVQQEVMLHFDGRNAMPDEDGRLRLHAQDSVSDQDFAPLASPLFTDLLSPKDRLIKPVCTVTIPVRDADLQGIDSPGVSQPPRYYVKFHARELVWKYYVLGNFAKKNAYITDANNDMEFESMGETALSDHRRALLFRSKRPIPLREKTDYRFQLREQGAGAGRILIPRLPVATADQFYKETIDGQDVMVSEVYVNY